MPEVSGAINVPVAVLWTEPGDKRPHDRLILGPVTDPAAWAGGMDDEMRLWLVGKVETQILLGEQVLVMDRKGDWVRVAAARQATERDSRGYPGWLPAVQVSFDELFGAEKSAAPAATVAVAGARLYADAAAREAGLTLSYQTSLPLLAEAGDTVMVGLPDGGHGYLLQRDIRQAAPESLADEARKFLGLRYIWGGASSFGFDCSGLTFRLYQARNTVIPRDADEQARAGVPVAKCDLTPGDLLFFADRQGQGAIHHVGVYSGDGNMIHAPNSRSAIREEPFDAGIYGQEYQGARRYR